MVVENSPSGGLSVVVAVVHVRLASTAPGVRAVGASIGVEGPNGHLGVVVEGFCDNLSQLGVNGLAKMPRD